MPHIQPAQLLWQTDQTGQQVPVSQLFGDLYFSRENGLAESQHVFLAGNQLAQRFAGLDSHEVFTIGELGFGTGLNVLATWQLWRQIRQQQADTKDDSKKNHSRLHIISTEKFPLTKADLSRALACWTELAELAQQLLDKYPPLLAGCHRLDFPEDNVTLDLWLGDAAESLAQVVSGTSVNAWYLDGFAPSYTPKSSTETSCTQASHHKADCDNIGDDKKTGSKKENDNTAENEEVSSGHSLWANEVLQQIQRLSSTGSTAATFSVAGIIKRGLMAHGFDIAKTKGFGRKREMLTATYTAPHSQSAENVIHSKATNVEATNVEAINVEAINIQVTKNKRLHIAVVGAGVAGLCTAYSFAQRGHVVTLFDKQPLAGASGNPRAMLAPKLTALHHVHEHLHSIGYVYATRFYQQFAGANNTPAVYAQTGVLDLLAQSNVTPAQITAYPDDFANMLTAAQSTEVAGIDLPACMQLPAAGLVNPVAFAACVLAHENIHLKQENIASIEKIQSNQPQNHIENHTENHIENHAEHTVKQVILHTSEQQQVTADAVVICTAQQCHLLHKNLPKPRTTRGQVSWFVPADTLAGQQTLPSVPLKYGGYCAAFTENDQAHFLLGASFVRGTQSTEVIRAEHQQNLEKLANAIHGLAGLPVTESWQGRASLRAQMPDYLPLVGRVEERVYTLAAMGSKGFAYAPICAEMLAAQVLGEALPLPKSLVKRLNPLRFLGKHHQ